MARVTAKLLEKLERKEKQRATSRPKIRETPVQSRNGIGASSVERIELNMVRHNLLGKIFRQNKPGIAGANFGERGSIEFFLAQSMGQPQWNCAGDLDFHENLISGQDPGTVGTGAETQILSAPAKICVEGDSQIGILLAEQSDAIVTEENLWLWMVQLHEMGNLLCDLGI